MARSKHPVLVIVSMTLIGALVTALARFAYLAYIIVQAGESLGSVPVKILLIDVMELHWFAIYGAVGGALFGIVLVVLDLARYGGQSEELSWKARETVSPFVGDEVKARRMEVGDRFLKEKKLKEGEEKKT